MHRDNKKFGSVYVPYIVGWIGLCAIHSAAEVPQDLLQQNTSKPFCFGTSCLTAHQTRVVKTLEQKTRNYSSSDWMKIWLENADLHEEPEIESSTSHNFDDDGSLGDNKLFRPYDIEDSG